MGRFKIPEILTWCIFFPLLSLDGLAAFRAFLKSEFCEENIEFWLACEDFKKTKSPQKLTSKAKKIYNDFIEKEAPKEVKKTYLNITALLYDFFGPTLFFWTPFGTQLSEMQHTCLNKYNSPLIALAPSWTMAQRAFQGVSI